MSWCPFSPHSLFGSLQEERVQDADSVWRQQQAHQQHSCTLDECFQSYTKEEQVLPCGPLLGWEGDSLPCGGLTVCHRGFMVLVSSFPAGPGRCMEMPPLQSPPAGHGEAEFVDPA
jgi:hypothetical protein